MHSDFCVFVHEHPVDLQMPAEQDVPAPQVPHDPDLPQPKLTEPQFLPAHAFATVWGVQQAPE